jgi:hypothetical protein
MRAGLVLLALATAGCNNPVYLSEKGSIETQPGMGMTAVNGYLPATGLYVLPVRRPTATEQQLLVADQMKRGLMMPEPWAASRDFDIEIEYSVRNLETTELIAFVVLDGGNEFGDYVPANYINPALPPGEQTPPPHLLGGEPLTIAAGGTVTGVFREDQLRESAIDLEAITRYPEGGDVLATPFRVIEHNSQISTIGLGSVPPNDVTPAHVRYAFTITAGGHVIMDYVVRVRDHAGKLASPTAMNLYVNNAALVMPPVAPPPRP